MTRVIVHLSNREWAALRVQAERDLRDMREQARWLIVRGLTAELAADVGKSGAAPAGVLPEENGHDRA